MQLKIHCNSNYKGFSLKEPALLKNKIIVLTGKNGSGKTRFLESLNNMQSVAYLNDTIIPSNKIRFITQLELHPSFGRGYNHAHQQEILRQTLEVYDGIKSDMANPLFLNNILGARYEENQGIGKAQLYHLCQKISKITGKKPTELTHSDISFNFSQTPSDILGVLDISEIINQYIKRYHDNQRNEWLSTCKNPDIDFYTEIQFTQKFGKRPWEELNKVLNDTFDGKFSLKNPDEESLTYNYQAQLIQCDGSQVLNEHLSSGERTLLWLALTIFNTQYHKENEEITPPDLILLDEPDAFLHPKMVVKMYNTLESLSENFGSTILLTTHSPTSVALAPDDSIYLVESNSIKEIEKDSAIADLLDGVTQISLNPKNHRQVFVESMYDAIVYNAIYTKIATRSEIIDPKITLSFISSGPKMPEQHLIDKVKSKLGIYDDDVLKDFIDSVNGAGNCVQVISQVEALQENENITVRGIIDWDLKNKPTEVIKVLASGQAYSIENITLDPICLLLLMHVDQPNSMTIKNICGEDIHWQEWLKNKSLLQKSIDQFIMTVFGKDNNKLAEACYFSGMKLKTDSDLLKMRGHDLEAIIKEKYKALKSFSRKGGDGELKCAVVNRAMINLTNCDFIPVYFEEVFSEIQK
ncbi:TPA: AAA family ATPase [Raoultella planticola]